MSASRSQTSEAGLAGPTPIGGAGEKTAGNAVAFLEPALWRQLADGAGPEARAPAWSALAASLIPGARQAAVVLASADGFAPAALWPVGDRPADLLMAAVEAALESRSGAVRLGRVHGPMREAAVAMPLSTGDETRGAVALLLVGADEDRLRLAMRHLRWGAGWFSDGGSGAEESGAARVLELLGGVIEVSGFRVAAQQAVTDLAARFACDRVSLGFRRGASARVVAISHSAVVDPSSSEARLLADAMDEAMDQRAILRAPPTQADLGEPLTRRAQEQLVGACGAAVLTLPLTMGDEVIGALVFERPLARPPSDEEIARLTLAAALLGPVLWEKWRDDRWLIARAGESIARQVRLLLGPDQVGRKLAVAAALLALGLGSTVHTTYEVVAQARLEGSVRRTVVSGLDGYLREAPARPGDRVHAGDLLAGLDDRDLVLERIRWSAEKQQRLQELERAIGDQRRAEANILRAEVEQADAQLALADARLARARFVAPFDGLVVEGDHSQSIGAAVRRGDVLFELTPLDSYHVALDVEETQIADVRPGQTGKLIVAAMPWQGLEFTVSRVIPLARVEDGQTVFRVEATLDENSPRLRPGMRGAARIDAGRRLAVWVWTRRLIEKARLSLWQVLP